ncbi:MAG: hypothetical protein KKF33_02810, partial [Alphaproteobacteria bacterium]|nr:hypothetical protein [Alphaproteobacteria bacterium]
MKRSPLPKEVSDRSTREFTWSFATGRLAEPELLEWAVALRGSEVIQRKTLRDLFEAQGSALPDFVASAWQWIIRSWDSPDAQDRYERLLFRKRAKKGHLVLRDVEVFVNGTRPVIEAKSRNILAEMYGSGREKNPKSMHDLVHFSITSSDADVSEAIGLLNDLDDPSLVQITLSLIAALVGMLFAAREMGLVGPDGDISLWQVRRAYFVPPDQYPDGGGEPDRHSRGFAPSVKLIHHALIELAERQPDFVRGTVLTLKAQDFALCQRLWAALARHEKLASGTDVAAFLSSLGHREFWSNSYPEYAELRAVRWDAMPSASRVVLEKRLRRGPPASLFPKRLTLDERKQAQLNSAVTELLRIKSANGELSSRTMTWLSETEGHQGIRLQKATDGFNQGSIVTWGRGSSANKFVPPRPERLLPALQKAIGTDIWSDEGQSAADYVASHASEILALLSANDSHPGRYAKVLNLLGHRFRPSDKTLSVEERELARSMVQLVASLSDETMQIAADGLSEWFSSWSKHLTINELPLSMWLRLWKAAVQSTNSSVNTDEVEMRSLNSPAGKMVSAFLDLCPTIDGTFDPFLGTELGRMRDALLLASGAAIEDVRFRLLSNLTYFFLASPAWTLHELVEPLSASS